MTEPTTITAEGGEIIRAMTPVAYQKAHLAEEARARHIADLHHFVDHMRAHIGDRPLTESDNSDIDQIVISYLDGAKR